MGQFRSGSWAVGLLLYFFGFFILVNSYVQGASDYGLDTTNIYASDAGFSTPTNQPFAQQGQCTGRAYYFCNSAGIDNQTVCEQFIGNGCYWSEGFFSEPSCRGVFETACTNIDDESTCRLFDCTWSDFSSATGAGTISPSSSFDWSVVKNTMLVMTGFNASIGIPASIAFIFGFIFFWIPFFMLLWALYMALPFLH